MTFPSLLKTLLKTYSMDACYLADHLGLPDERVEDWLEGRKLPTPKEQEDLASGFALPLSLVQSSCEESKRP